MVSGLSISSPTAEQSPRQILSVNTKVLSSMSMRPSTFSASDMSPRPQSALPADFTEEFRNNLIRQISDNIESKMDRHFSQLVSAAALPLSPATSDHDGPTTDDSIVLQLKKLLRNTTTELERVKGKNQELREDNHKLELQRLEATHQVERLHDIELNNQVLLSRIKELESCPSASSVDSLETSSMNGHGHRTQQQQHKRNSSTASASHLVSQTQHIQRLMREVASLKAERDALKITSWELEKKPFAQQHQQRPPHFVDLENERNRLVEELGAKTVAMEDLWNKNEALLLRAKEYEKRVWELEGQCSALEQECKTLPKIRSDLVEMEARVVAADALVEKLQDMEGQVTVVKTLQDRIHELETTNAELDHSNWDLSERLNVANNQLALLTKEFETFRSKDKDDRRLEFLANKNRELETLLAEQAKISPDYKNEFEQVSVELEKVKVRMPQLEGQAKQVTLLRSKVLQLEKQIKTMEELHPQLEEIQKLHERNTFLENELGELEALRAREMELEGELEEAKVLLKQLDTNKTRVASLSGAHAPSTRARSASVSQYNPTLFEHGEENSSGLQVKTSSLPQSPSELQSPNRRTSQSMSPLKTTVAPAWPSGRRSASLSIKRMSISSLADLSLANGSNSSEAESPRETVEGPASTETS